MRTTTIANKIQKFEKQVIKPEELKKIKGGTDIIITELAEI